MIGYCQIGDLDKAGTIKQGADRRVVGAVESLTQPLGEGFLIVARCHRAPRIAFPQCQAAMFGAAQHVRLLKDGVEHRGEIAGRGVDDAEDFCRRDLLSKRLVTFGFEFVALSPRLGELPFKVTDDLSEIGRCALRRGLICDLVRSASPEGSYPDR